MGIPGFSGFAAEITILIGAWKAYPIAVLITGVGMVLVAAFTIRALKRTFFDDFSPISASATPALSSAEDSLHQLEPITIAEKLGAILLMLATLAGGLYPKFLLDRIIPAVEAMRVIKNSAM
jgi:NADH-quinone oxidoreductase subunit M